MLNVSGIDFMQLFCEFAGKAIVLDFMKETAIQIDGMLSLCSLWSSTKSIAISFPLLRTLHFSFKLNRSQLTLFATIFLSRSIFTVLNEELKQNQASGQAVGRKRLSWPFIFLHLYSLSLSFLFVQ